MQIVLLCALGVGGATVLGAILGFVMKNITHRFSDIVLAFAAGVMLASAVLGLIIPSLESGGGRALIVTTVGIFTGALSLNLIDKLVPHNHKYVEEGEVPEAIRRRRVMLFVTAIAMHNLPEGMAVGVAAAGFLAGSIHFSAFLTLSLGIALQNLPEGAIISLPLQEAGSGKYRAFATGALSGVVEPIGGGLTLLLAALVVPVLPFLLSLAAGSMLYVVVQELIPDMQEDGRFDAGAVFFTAGFSLMMLLDVILG